MRSSCFGGGKDLANCSKRSIVSHQPLWHGISRIPKQSEKKFQESSEHTVVFVVGSDTGRVLLSRHGFLDTQGRIAP